MTKDKKELDALAELCSENNVHMVRRIIPADIAQKRSHLKRKIIQCKSAIYELRQIFNRAEFYRARSKDPLGLDNLIRFMNSRIAHYEEKRESCRHSLDGEYHSKNHQLNPGGLGDSAVTEKSSLGKLTDAAAKPIPINKQTMKVIDYKKGDVFKK